jgi:hypothetical protein
MKRKENDVQRRQVIECVHTVWLERVMRENKEGKGDRYSKAEKISPTLMKER